jgi:hypothetical protein
LLAAMRFLDPTSRKSGETWGTRCQYYYLHRFRSRLIVVVQIF